MVDPKDPDLPADFGKYRLERRIATGGMAEIFLAHRHDDPGRPLVIKRILPHLGQSPDFVSMFLDEARIAARLSHPNIVAIEDIGQQEGAYYLVMEYVHGEDIRRIYNRAYKLQRSLPLSHSIRVIAEAARGLGFAHKLTDDLTGRAVGVVHRDVSPQNILVTYEGDAKVVDFGIAKAANKVAQTRAGVLKGKYSYMSPEQALGDPLDHRTDIFALGIILYETTTGTRLFKRGSELATLQAIIKCELTPPSQALPGYPPELEDILLKALARRPEDRWDDAEQLAAALYEFLHESGLYVGREVLADFMKDLFADRRDDEDGRGRVALPAEDEVRAELAVVEPKPARPERKAASGREPNASETLDARGGRLARTEARASGSGRAPTTAERPQAAIGFMPRGEVEVGATTPELDHEDLGGDPSSAEDTGHPAGARRRGSTRLRARDEEVAPAETPPDLLPTVAAQPSYRPTPRSASAEEDEEPSARVAGQLAHDGTEQLPRRRGAVRRGEEPPSARAQSAATEEAPRGPAGRGWSWFVLGAVGAALLVTAGTGLAVSRMLSARGATGREAGAGAAEQGVGRLVVSTEPGAVVQVDGRALGAADAHGEAGPFEVPAGKRVVRVASAGLGFERQRTLEVEARQNYHVEIRARQGGLRLLVAPWARVTIDGKDLGLTPLPRLGLAEGVHRVVLENDDLRRRYEGTVQIEADRDAELKLDLKAAGRPYP